MANRSDDSPTAAEMATARRIREAEMTLEEITSSRDKAAQSHLEKKKANEIGPIVPLSMVAIFAIAAAGYLFLSAEVKPSRVNASEAELQKNAETLASRSCRALHGETGFHPDVLSGTSTQRFDDGDGPRILVVLHDSDRNGLNSRRNCVYSADGSAHYSDNARP